MFFFEMKNFQTNSGGMGFAVSGTFCIFTPK